MTSPVYPGELEQQCAVFQTDFPDASMLGCRGFHCSENQLSPTLLSLPRFPFPALCHLFRRRHLRLVDNGVEHTRPIGPFERVAIELG